ncbi:MAG: RNase adapter RapZ [Myxococcota bacterium]|nr:RNase adapter RapZ [Myxococcota bacterium]MDW8361490.1 RNase adapter RapZ [Myxococcales bacterium]
MGGRTVVVVTGMSGAGRSTALAALEDLRFFCVDNLPPTLAPRVLELLGADPVLQRVAFGVDVRTGGFLEGASAVLDALREAGHDVEILFLDAADEALVRRFSETRRPHPLAPTGDVLEAIARERERLAPLRARATRIIDTTHTSVHALRRMLTEWMSRRDDAPRMVVRVVSFGFKYGLPVDADLVFDVRYLPNPHFEPALRARPGTDPEVARFVLEAAETRALLERIRALLGEAVPNHEREGKAYLTIAVGCTGGRHRSVAVAEELGQWLAERVPTRVVHRDVDRGGS